MIKIIINFYFFNNNGSFAQNASIKGIVIDSLSNGNTLIGANVILEGTSLGTATDNEGVLYIKNINPAKYIIKVSYILDICFFKRD